MNDLKFGLRQLARSPGFTIVAVLTLALGIGANAAIVTIINSLLFKPVLARDPGRLVGLYQREVENPDNYKMFSFPDFRDLQTDKSVLSDLAAWNMTSVGAREGDLLRKVDTAAVSASYFSTLGIPPLLGRTFLPDEDTSRAQTLVLSYAYWQTLGGRPEIIGSRIKLAPGDFTVVGVMPEGFQGSSPSGRSFYLPLGALPLLWERGDATSRRLEDRANRPFMLIGRIKEGQTRDSLAAGLKIMSERFRVSEPAEIKGRELVGADLPRFSFSNRPSNFMQKVAPLAGFALTLSGLVLAVSCLNLANMLLARGTARRKEIAVRLAIGASRKRVLRQLLSEGFLLAILGGAAGMLIASWSTFALAKSVTEAALDPTPDVRVLGALILLCGGATMVFALGPAWKLASLDVNADLKQQSGVEIGGFRIKNLLVIGQLAFSVALVATAVLFVRSAAQAVRADIGIPLGTDLVIRLDAGLANLAQPAAREVFREAEDRLASIPGVQAVSSARMVPFGGEWHVGFVQPTAGEPKQVEVNHNVVGSEYFRAVGVSMLRGRDFTRAEAISKPALPVVILTAGAAEKLWPGEDPIGRSLKFAGSSNVMEVVGVAPNITWDLFEKKQRDSIFTPRGQSFDSSIRLHVKVAPNADSTAIMAMARSSLNSFPVTEITTLGEMHRTSSSVRLINIGAGLFGAFGAVALFLSFLGVYGLRSYQVARRVKEIGVRMALGATASGVMKMIVGEGGRVVAVGIFVGLFLAVAFGQVAGRFLYGVSGTDPVAYLAIAVALGAVAMVACWLPARRATKVNPMQALRCE